jgi:purine-nucleoside phosphorylase
MNMTLLAAMADQVRRFLPPPASPRLGLVLGSGWAEAVEAFDVKASMDYARIVGLGAPQVEGHGGRLLLAERDGREALIFVGRRHWYEGVGWEPVAFPVYCCKALGVTRLLLTNSAGGIHPAFTPGTLMLITDHLNLMGVNPLAGPHEAFWGPQFPDMSCVYDREGRALLNRAAAEAGVALQPGVYLAVSGPSYETPAEIAAFRRLGADAVGMSTAPEAILAHAAGLRVTGLSCITNPAAGAGRILSHEEVLAGARRALPGLKRLIGKWARLGAEP